MKNSIPQLSVSLFTILLLAGCGGSGKGDSGGDVENSTRLLEQKTSLDGKIDTVADVDWYTININEPGIVALKVNNNTMRYDVDILATIYEEDANGNRVRIAADHFPEESASSSTININVNITQPQKLAISIRDLDDNDYSATEIYTISYDVAAPEDNNGTFDTAVDVLLDSRCHTDSIGTVGDTDVMQFTLLDSGVYDIATEFTAFAGGTSVDLKVSLFASDGELIRSITKTVDSYYRMVESLPAGSYYVLVSDQGKDSFDTSSPYTTCLTSVTTSEVSTNDTQEAAATITGDGHYVISGSLDYADDQDWSSIQSGPAPTSIQVLQVTFDPSESNGCNSWFLLEIKDSSDNVLFSKEYSTETNARKAEIKVETIGEHFISVSAIDNQVCNVANEIGMRYEVTVDSVDVSDDAEMGGGNNTINTAIELDESGSTETQARLSYVGDVDWYKITVAADHSQDRVLEVFIESESVTPLEYNITIFRADDILDAFSGWESAEYPVSFKSSYFVPQSPGNTNSDYFVKIVDMQSDESDIDNSYSVRSNIVPITTQAPATGDARVSNASFYDESSEQSALTVSRNVLKLIVDANESRDFSYNATAFSLASDLSSSLITNPEADIIEVTFPWQSGFIDYYSDRDWYQLDIAKNYIAAGGIAETWYSEIQVELYSPAPGSIVEYAWGLYRDSSNNGTLEDWQGDDGLFASNGDVNATVTAVDLITPAADATGPMWVNHETAADAFYLTVADILNKSTNVADNDWGYDAPYFVRVKLIYHSNSTQP